LPWLGAALKRNVVVTVLLPAADQFGVLHVAGGC
jgi:hypothetical protein